MIPKRLGLSLLLTGTLLGGCAGAELASSMALTAPELAKYFQPTPAPAPQEKKVCYWNEMSGEWSCQITP